MPALTPGQDTFDEFRPAMFQQGGQFGTTVREGVTALKRVSFRAFRREFAVAAIRVGREQCQRPLLALRCHDGERDEWGH